MTPELRPRDRTVHKRNFYNTVVLDVNRARKHGMEAGRALERREREVHGSVEKMEKLAEERGLEMGRASLEQLDKLWDEVKKSH